MNKNDMRAALKGAALLVSKGYFRELTSLPVEDIDQRHCDTCVVGRIFGSFTRGLEELSLDWFGSNAYGFNCDEGIYCCKRCNGPENEWRGDRTSWDGLNEAWSSIISALRLADEASATLVLSEMEGQSA